MCLFFIITVIICFSFGRHPRFARVGLSGGPGAMPSVARPTHPTSCRVYAFGSGPPLRFGLASLRTGFASLATPPIPGVTGPGDFRQNALFSFLDSAVAPFQTDENLRPPTNSGLNRSEIRRPFKGRTRHPRTLFIIPRKKSTTTFKRMATCILVWK